MLCIENVTLSIAGRTILSNVKLALTEGEIVGLLGRSGSGKSLLAASILGLAPKAATLTGKILFHERDLASCSEADLRRVRGCDVAMIFQEPMTALNPMQSIGHQIAEAIRLHKNLSDDEATQRVAALLRDVGLSDDGVTADRFPHELSGGQRQRVVVAMAIALQPKLVIADEPTTALDVSTQREILSLLRRLASQHNIAILLITHDRGVAAEIADRIAIIEDGAIRRVGTPEALLQEKISPLISAETSESEVSKRNTVAGGGKFDL